MEGGEGKGGERRTGGGEGELWYDMIDLGGFGLACRFGCTESGTGAPARWATGWQRWLIRY